MEAIISIAGAFASKAAEYTVDPTARQLSYLFKPKAKFQNLRTKVQDLKDAKERVQQSVDAAKRNGGEIFGDVQRWLTEVNEKISEQAATQLQEDEEKATKRCFSGFCLDFKSRYHLSKKADKEANAITQLLAKKDAFKIDNAVSYLPPVEGTDIIRPVKEYEAFESRSAAFDGVMAALKDDAVGIIGVYGMGGVGKTTLVKEVAGQAKEKLSFDEVVFVAVTQTSNTVKIQNEIANQLGLELDKDSSEHVRAARLRDRLKNAKKVLVILDDIWEKLEVDSLGIPSANEHKGCKILMTSRKLIVLKSMESQKNLTIDLLNEDEAWSLFKNVTGHFDERPDLQSTAKKVAQKCAGLPLAITTVAQALKHKENLYEWNDALEQLKPSENNFQGISDEAYTAIELSYKYLKSKELKYTFLLCSIMGHDAAMQDLLKHCRGLRLFRGLDTMEKVRNRVLTLVSELKDSSLLLAGSTSERFDMHDVVCDVAISIASRDHCWLALRKEDVFEEWSITDTMRNSKLVSLKYAKVSELPDELECPKLTFFSTHGTVEVPDNFFKRMQTLKVLEFASTGFTSLPSSIGSLKSLCTLRLIGCDLEDIGILGELGKLEILDLRRSTMKILPEEIGQMIGLKLLDLSECYRLEVITPNVLSKLSRLEELYLYGSFDRWEVEGIENPRSNASLVELQHLPRLTTLEVHIPDVEAIPKGNLFLGKMERYKVSIGLEGWSLYGNRGMVTSRMLKLNMNKSIHLVDEIKLLLLYLDGLKDVGEMQMLCHPNVESFGQLKFMKVENCHMLKNLFSFSIAKTLCQLEELEVFDCENITELIAENEEIDENHILEFNKLRILKLENLQSFNGLLYSENTPQSSPWLSDKKVSCPALEELRVKRSHKLKHVFTSSMVKSFVHLKKLEVSNCPEMEGVIEGTLAAEEGISSSIRVFSKLDYLNLDTLPKLREFCCGINSIEFPSLRRLEIQNCHDLKTFVFEDVKSRVASSHCLFNEKVIFPVLEELRIAKMDKLKRLWPDLLVEYSFSKLTSIELRSCESVEEIIFGSEYRSQGGSSSAKDVITFEFPALTSLELFDMPNLRSIHHNKMHTINWPSLEEMRVNKCCTVEILFAYGETSSEQPLFWVNESTFPSLYQLTLESNAGMKEMIWHCQGQQQHQLLSPYFPNLKVVRLWGYPKQVTVLPSYLFHLLSLPTLQTLEISHSFFKEMIFQSEEGGEEKPASLLLSQITELRLFYLTELMHLWKEKEGFPNLCFLYVEGCSGLKANLVPSSVSFRNLVNLKVSKCHGIVKLITHSTAKSLVQLKQMSIKRCENIEEIIQGEDDDDEISFPHLNCLELEYLPKLEIFCSSEKYTFKFQSLEYLKVCNCPNMKMFSKGDAYTPLLHKVLIRDYGSEGRWEGSLNSTIQELFREEHTISTKEDQDNPSILVFSVNL